MDTDRHVPLLEHMHSHHYTYESITVHVAIGLHGFYETTSHVRTIINIEPEEVNTRVPRLGIRLGHVQNNSN